MSAWITDRLPTERDADAMQMVTVCTSSGMMYNVDMGLVNPTYHTAWRTPTYPEPYQKPKVWSWEKIRGYKEVYKNGKHLWTFGNHELTEEQADAIVDALNRLEEGV